MKNIIGACMVACELLSAAPRVFSEEWTAVRSAGQNSVSFALNLAVYRTEYRLERRVETVCVRWDIRTGGCMAWMNQVFWDNVPFEVYDHSQPSFIQVVFPPEAVLAGGERETVTLEYFHNAGFLSRYDAFQVHMDSQHYDYEEPTFRFDNVNMPPSYTFNMVKTDGKTSPGGDPVQPGPDPALVQFVKENLSFTLGTQGESGVLNLAINPAVFQSKSITGIQYQVDKFFKGSTMSFIVVKGERDFKDAVNGAFSIPLYQALTAENIYQITFKVNTNFNKAAYEWSAPIQIGLSSEGTGAVPAEDGARGVSPTLLRLRALPKGIAPF